VFCFCPSWLDLNFPLPFAENLLEPLRVLEFLPSPSCWFLMPIFMCEDKAVEGADNHCCTAAEFFALEFGRGLRFPGGLAARF
jgi:hypothetical protein